MCVCERECVIEWVCVLTRYSSKVNGLFGPCRAALSGARAVLTGCIHMKPEDVVLLHHWRHRHTHTAVLQQAWATTQLHVHKVICWPKLTCDCVPLSVTQRVFRSEGGGEFTFSTVYWHNHLHTQTHIVFRFSYSPSFTVFLCCISVE